MTPRQLEVARLIAEAYTDKQIAARLKVSTETVAYHIGQIVDRWSLDRSYNLRVLIATRWKDPARWPR